MSTMGKLSWIAGALALSLSCAATQAAPAQKAPPVFQSTDRVLAYYGPAVREKLKPLFADQDIAYPPLSMTWIALKEEKR